MSWLRNAVKSVGNFVKDISKASIALPLESISSVTGKKYVTKYDTQLGGTIGKGAVIGLQSVHIVGKSFANVVTGGYASKVTNLARPKDRQESFGKYNAFEDTQTGAGGFGVTEKFSELSKKGAQIVGTIYGGQVASTGKGKQLSEGLTALGEVTEAAGILPGDTIPPKKNKEEESSSLWVWVGVLTALAVIGYLIKRFLL